jgi:PAS domain S-box-containing protein
LWLRPGCGSSVRLASFPELNPNPVVEVDILGTTCYLNPAARRLFPGIEKEGTSHPWLAGLGPAIHQLQGGKETVGEVVTGYDYSVEFEDGTVRHLSGNASPLFDSDRRPRGAVSAIMDVTERKKMDEELKVALAEKELLLRELSHRTKNNLQMIVNLLGMQATKSGDATLVRASRRPGTGSGPWRWCTRSSTARAAFPP